MDDEEAEGLLQKLRAALAEFGSPAIVPPRHIDPEEGQPDLRSELHRILDEYEAILVDAPMMMKTTMGILKARSLRFVADRDDRRFAVRSADANPQSAADIALTTEDMEVWLGVAGEASGVIAELRERLDDQPR